jgi:phosphohistidine phosphatase SixA
VLAEAGCSEREIAAVLGDRDLRMARVYTTGANRKKMGWQALSKTFGGEQPGTTNLHTPGADLHTAPKHVGNERK